MCSINDNIYVSDTYGKICLGLNVFSLFMFLGNYINELRREHWCIKYLDIDSNKADNALKAIIKNEPELDKQMDKINLEYYRFCIYTSIVYILNVIISLKYIDDHYYNSSTYNSFVSFVLLISLKLYNSMVISYNSVKNDKMMSAFLSEFTSYNVFLTIIKD